MLRVTILWVLYVGHHDILKQLLLFLLEEVGRHGI